MTATPDRLRQYIDAAAVALGGLRQRVLSQFGRHGTHAIEDGIAVGLLFGLLPTYPPAAAVIFLALGFSARVGPAKLLKAADVLVREKAVRAQPLHFIIPLLVSAGLGVGIGRLLSALVPALGLNITIAV